MTAQVDLLSPNLNLCGDIGILEDFEEQLKTVWRMGIKASSRSCMAAQGSSETPTDPSKWPVMEVFPVLGHMLQNNGSIRACWRRARSAMWASFWTNPASKDAQHLSFDEKALLLKRAVAPQLDFRCSRWAPQKQVAAEIDRLQTKMTATLLKIPFIEGELPEDYVRRRGRLAAQLSRSHGLWSDRWFERAIRWDEHLARPRNARYWASKLRCYRDRDWFILRRSSFAPSLPSRQSPACSTAGRTDTRTGRFKVHARWHDGIQYARDRGCRAAGSPSYNS